MSHGLIFFLFGVERSICKLDRIQIIKLQLRNWKKLK